jgi:hypothetical protein
LQLHKGIKVVAAWERPYFPHGTFHFPYYRQNYAKGQVFISPFGFYFGICAPFLDPSCCHIFPPTIAFIDIPVYNGNDCTGYAYDQQDNWFDHSDLNDSQPGLVNAVDELSETFQNGNIDALATLISPNVSISVYLRGKYKYSLASSDFVDLTRDAIMNTHTVSFNLTTLFQRESGVFCASGTQVYTDRNGANRTVYVSYVLQDFSGQWTLTQVGTAPDHVQAWN